MSQWLFLKDILATDPWLMDCTLRFILKQSGICECEWIIYLVIQTVSYENLFMSCNDEWMQCNQLMVFSFRYTVLKWDILAHFVIVAFHSVQTTRLSPLWRMSEDIHFSFIRIVISEKGPYHYKNNEIINRIIQRYKH